MGPSPSRLGSLIPTIAVARPTRDPSPFIVRRGTTVADVIRCIDSNEEGIALLVGDGERLVDTITDGDVRRAFLSGCKLDDTAEQLLERGKPADEMDGPTVATTDMAENELLHLMTSAGIRQIPILDGSGRVVDIAFMHDLVEVFEDNLEAIVMAGGLGSRLLPLTEQLPKPLLPVGDKPVMERLLTQLRTAGITEVHVAVHHMSDKIEKHFGDGSDLGVHLSYMVENKPLGTAGSLRSLAKSKDPFLVINADIITTLSYRALVAYHREHQADITVAVRQYEVAVPYGVLECDGPRVTGIQEKPVSTFLVNAGIYLVEPDAVRHIPENGAFDMTDLVNEVLRAGGIVHAFPIHEYWIDVGQHEDYAAVQRAFQEGTLD